MYLPNIKQVQIDEPQDEPEYSFWQRRALDLRLTTTMTTSTRKPYWNTTMVTAWVAVIVGMFTILGAIGGLYLYTDSVAEKRGIEKGRMAAEREQTQRQLTEQSERLAETERLLKLAVSGEEETKK